MVRWRGSSWSTTSLVLVAAAAALAGGGVQYVASHMGAPATAPARSATAYASPAATDAPEGLQLVMAGNTAQTEASSATGPAGASHTEATEGAEGPAGLDGAAGADGVDGAAGTDGANGEDGGVGPEGPAGSVGATGPAGSVGATGPAGIGLTAVDRDGGGFEFRSPDGVSYRIHVTNSGIVFAGPKTTQVWSDSARFQTLVP